MKYIKLLAVLSALCVASFSHAKDARGFYVGVGAGTVELNDLDDSLNGPYEDDSGFTHQVSTKVDGTAIKLIAGYQINRVLAFEAQYTKYGDVNSTDTTNVFGHQVKGTKTILAPEAFSFSLNAGYTFNNGLRPFGILGMSAVDINQSLKLYADDLNPGMRYGVGLEYTPPAMNRLSIRTAYEADMFYLDPKEAIEFEDYILSSVYVSLSYKF